MIRSFDGHPFDPAADVWNLGTPSGPRCFNFLSLPGASDQLRAHAKSALAVLISSRPPERPYMGLSHTRALLRSIVQRDPQTVVEQFTAADLQGYQTSLPPMSRYRAGALRDFLLMWVETGAGGLSADLVSFLPRMQVERHVAGEAVRTCSPTHGALTVAQRDALLTALHSAYAAGKVALDNYAIALLITILALRPLQVACIKVRDLLTASDASDFSSDLLVTRLKQGRGTRPRHQFTKFGLIREISDILHLQRRAAIAWAAVRGVVADDAPLFPGQDRRNPSGRRPERLSGFEGHMSGSSVSIRLRCTLNRPDVLAELGGGRVFPLRLRRTLATIQSAEGRTLAEIAAQLDHTRRTQPLAYIEQTPELVDRLDEALGASFARFAAGFLHPPPTVLVGRSGTVLPRDKERKA